MARTQYQSGMLLKQGKRQPMWYGRYREPIIRNGTIVRVYRKVRLGRVKELTEKQAYRALEPFLKQVNDPSFRPKQKMLLEEFVPLWRQRVLESKSDPKEPSSVLNFELHLKKHILPALGKIALDRIDAEVLQTFVSSLDKAPKTVKNIFATLRMVLKSAWKWNYFPGDLSRILESVDLPDCCSKGRTFTLQEAIAIISEANGPLQLFLCLAAETGPRSGELCGLRVSDVTEFQGCGIVKIEQTVWRGRIKPRTKTKAGEREVPISSELYKRIREYVETDWKANDHNLLFATRNGTPWNASLIVTRKLHPILKKLGIPKAGLHAFRHMNGSLMDVLNAPLKVRQTRLGHADVKLTLNTYTHTRLTEMLPVAQEMGRILHPNWSQVPSESDAA